MARLKPAIENLWPIEINQTNFLKLIELISIVIINKSKNFKVPKYFFFLVSVLQGPFYSSLAAVKSIEFNAYSLSKGAVISLTKAASADLGKNGIRVNTIIPGTIETPMTKIICDYPNVLNSCIEKTALGHIGEADDIAYCALYLASDESKYTTGTDITIDGGQRYKDTLELEM